MTTPFKNRESSFISPSQFSLAGERLGELVFWLEKLGILSLAFKGRLREF
jgi:hypothetical protein